MASSKKVVVAPVVEEVTTQVIVENVVPKMNIGNFCKDKILNTNWTNKEILDSVLIEYPNAKTTYACIAWYRSDLRSKGLIGPKVSKKQVQLELPLV